MASPHGSHPSLFELERKKSVQTAKDMFLEKVIASDAELSDREYDVIPNSIEEERLLKFRHSGDKYFKILVPSIKIYKDKLLKLPNKDLRVYFNENDVIQGTYVDNKRVLFGAPYNVYCNAIDIEPIDIDHSAYLRKLKEQQMNKERRHKPHQHLSPNEYKQAPHAMDADDEYKISEDVSDAEMEEKVQLMVAKPKDPSLSDYQSVADDKNGRKAYDKSSDTNEQTPIIIMKKDAFYKRYPYNICIACFVFLCLLILDMLLMVFLADLNALMHEMNEEICEEAHLGLIYDHKYMALAVVAFFALASFCNLMYFMPQIVTREFGRLLIHSVCVMLMLLYSIASGWQMMGMNKAINRGIEDIHDDDTCNGAENDEYIENMQETYNVIAIVTLLKVLQAIALFIATCCAVFIRSRSKNTYLKF